MTSASFDDPRYAAIYQAREDLTRALELLDLGSGRFVTVQEGRIRQALDSVVQELATSAALQLGRIDWRDRRS
jgi:hypothetical protein